jgi:hypothetical protein
LKLINENEQHFIPDTLGDNYQRDIFYHHFIAAKRAGDVIILLNAFSIDKQRMLHSTAR